jgi:hypothetical protein
MMRLCRARNLLRENFDRAVSIDEAAGEVVKWPKEERAIFEKRAG